MKSISPHLIYETFAFSDPNSLSTVNYRQLMLDTIFIPCPTGWWNLDSFRVYEALECGCIPIVEKQPLDYFRKFFPDHPFIAVDSWDQAPQQIKLLMDNPAELENAASNAISGGKIQKNHKKNRDGFSESVDVSCITYCQKA